MEKILVYARWIGLLLGVTLLVHTYIWWRLVKTTQIGKPWSTWLTALVIFLAFAYVTPFLIARNLESPFRQMLSTPSYIWMGLSLLFLTAFLGFDLVRIFLWLGQKALSLTQVESSPERRLFLSRSMLGLFSLGAFGTGLYSIRSAFKGPILKKVNIPLDKLPKSLSGLTLLQISDLHVGDLIQKKEVQSVVRKANETSPDIIVITGDLVDHHATFEDLSPLADLKSRYGVFFVTGNHEYYTGVQRVLASLKKLNIRVLRNECIPIEKNGESINLLGVDDFHASYMEPGHGPNLKKAMEKANPKTASVLLAHQPKEIHNAAASGVDLQLSGHTHGGQIWPFRFLVRLSQPYIAGLYKHENTWIYVNRGTGFWGPPMRLGGESELTLISLTSPLA